MKTAFLKYTVLATAVSMTMTSCDDFFDLRPTNKMVIDDYWQSEDDVLAVTASIYDQLNSEGCMQRLLLWSEFRSDNCLLSNTDNSDISAFSTLTLSPTNGYTSWGDFYTAINYCNTVEAFAPRVCEASPTFTRAQLDAYIAEVRGLRALCYFTLIRTFRDIPFVLEPTIDDEVEFDVPQSDPDDIVDYLINDLKEYEGRAQTSFANTLYLHGRMTQAGIRALLADMLLWRGRWSECIEYCDKILTDANNPLSLVEGANYASQVFINGNSRESIFELQFSGSTTPNYALRKFYGKSDGGYGEQYFIANDVSSIFELTDARLYNSMQFNGVSDATRCITKYAQSVTNPFTANDRRYNPTDLTNSNWIFYRLADIYLMKAEALAESNGDLETVWELCSKTYDRANYNSEAGLLPHPATTEEARNLVMNERQREFMFEGKRYFDILRRIKNHPDEFQNMVANYLKPRYIREKVDNQTINAKLISVDALYMPINNNELRHNTQLVQNPFYKTSSNIEKN
ncbi:MAG: RagB/SusD family nutrient uptake outer membrane protein [Clostridium sp.]|nr:RagB/SusD family nutrient uptake outer membrane protein [Clostridium sp.]